jgi:hypothetical protein
MYEASHLLSSIVGLVFTLVGIVIVFKVGAAILPVVLQAIGSIVNAFNTGSVNDTTGNAILGIAGLVVAVLAVLGLLFLFINAAFAAGGGKSL